MKIAVEKLKFLFALFKDVSPNNVPSFEEAMESKRPLESTLNAETRGPF